MAHWVERESRRANRNLLIINLVLLVGAVLVFAVNRDLDFRSDYVGIGIGVLVILLAGWNLVKAFRRYAEIQTSPVWKHAAVYGDVEQLAMQIEQEQQMQKTKYGRLVVTPNWLIRRSLFRTWMSPVEDLAWIYKKITKHYTNFIPTGKSYAAVLVGRHRQRIDVQMSQKKTDKLLGDLNARVPWVIVGFSKDLANTWQKDPAAFVAAVDARRQKSASTAG